MKMQYRECRDAATRHAAIDEVTRVVKYKVDELLKGVGQFHWRRRIPEEVVARIPPKEDSDYVRNRIKEFEEAFREMGIDPDTVYDQARYDDRYNQQFREIVEGLLNTYGVEREPDLKDWLLSLVPPPGELH
jgi:hypothetical protein